MTLLAITSHGGLRLAEVGFVLLAIAGVALALRAVMPSRRQAVDVIAGLALAVGALLLIVAAHWGHFG